MSKADCRNKVEPDKYVLAILSLSARA